MIKELVKTVVPHTIWARIAHLRWRLESEAQGSGMNSKYLGWNVAFRLPTLAVHRYLRSVASKYCPLRSIRLSGYDFPLYYRPWSSDLKVIQQVFERAEYNCVGSELNINSIIDCGANIGCTSFYLLHRYPLARAVVVEPDPDNMRVCRRNLAPFADRVTFIESGVWSRSTSMVIERGMYRDGEEWSYQVRPAQPGEPLDFTALTLNDIFDACGFSKVDLLKIDIEAAEAEIFCENSKDWLNRTRNLVIELHGSHCEKVVNDTLASYRFQSDCSGELTVFRNIVPISALGISRD